MSTFLPLDTVPLAEADALCQLKKTLERQQTRSLDAQMIDFANNMTLLDFKSEAGNYDFIPSIPLFEALHEVAKGRHKFARSLDYLGNAPHLSLFRDAAAQFRQLDSATNYMVDKHLWGGLSVINPSNAVAIVGSYEEVRATLLDFHRVGADYILVASSIKRNRLSVNGRKILSLTDGGFFWHGSYYKGRKDFIICYK